MQLKEARTQQRKAGYLPRCEIPSSVAIASADGKELSLFSGNTVQRRSAKATGERTNLVKVPQLLSAGPSTRRRYPWCILASIRREHEVTGLIDVICFAFHSNSKSKLNFQRWFPKSRAIPLNSCRKTDGLKSWIRPHGMSYASVRRSTVSVSHVSFNLQSGQQFRNCKRCRNRILNITDLTQDIISIFLWRGSVNLSNRVEKSAL